MGIVTGHLGLKGHHCVIKMSPPASITRTVGLLRHVGVGLISIALGSLFLQQAIATGDLGLKGRHCDPDGLTYPPQ